MLEAVHVNIHKYQLVFHRQDFLELGLQVFLAINAHANMAVGFRQLDEVRQRLHVRLGMTEIGRAHV